MHTVAIIVKPGSSRDNIEMTSAGILVRIRARPIDGEANAYLLDYLSTLFALRKSEVVLLKGSTSRQKKIGFHITEEQYLQKLRALI